MYSLLALWNCKEQTCFKAKWYRNNKKAAEVREDVSLLDRIRSNKKFSYHLGNKCYKTYTHKHILKKSERKRIRTEISLLPEDSNETEVESKPELLEVKCHQSVLSPVLILLKKISCNQ